MDKVIIIGGVAGLCAGIYLQKAGYNSVIYEKHSIPGGNLTGWDRGEYHIDNCIHWLTGTADGNAVNKIWHETGALDDTVGLHRGEYFYISELGGESLAMYADPERTRSAMKEQSPADSKEIDRFIDAVICAAGRMKPGKKSGTGACMIKTVAEYKGITLFELAARFRHPLLRLVMTDYIGGEFSAFSLVLAYASFASGNGSVPSGGSRAMAERMAQTYTGQGGKLVTGREVTKLLTEGRRAVGVLLDDGNVVGGDWIICACDPRITFGRLLDESAMPRRLQKRYDDKIHHPVFSSCHAAFACEASDELIPGTVIFDADIPDTGRKTRRVAFREYSHEPSFAPQGKSVLQSILFTPEQTAADWIRLKSTDPEGYSKKKKEYTDALQSALYRRYPVLEGKLTLIDSWTPATYNSYLGSPDGAYMAFVFTEQARWTGIPSRIKSFDNILLATQWQRTPGGLPNAALAGKHAAEFVIKSKK